MVGCGARGGGRAGIPAAGRGGCTPRPSFAGPDACTPEALVEGGPPGGLMPCLLITGIPAPGVIAGGPGHSQASDGKQEQDGRADA